MPRRRGAAQPGARRVPHGARHHGLGRRSTRSAAARRCPCASTRRSRRFPEVEAAVYLLRGGDPERRQARRPGHGAVTVSARAHAGRVTFEIRDDGVGFDVDALDDGHGLTNLQDRLAAVSGEVHVHRPPAAGPRSAASAGRDLTGHHPPRVMKRHPAGVHSGPMREPRYEIRVAGLPSTADLSGFERMQAEGGAGRACARARSRSGPAPRAAGAGAIARLRTARGPPDADPRTRASRAPPTEADAYMGGKQAGRDRVRRRGRGRSARAAGCSRPLRSSRSCRGPATPVRPSRRWCASGRVLVLDLDRQGDIASLDTIRLSGRPPPQPRSSSS